MPLFGAVGIFSASLGSLPAAHAACGAVTCFVVIGSQQQVPQAGLLTFNSMYNYTPMRLLDGTSGVIPAINQEQRLQYLHHPKPIDSYNPECPEQVTVLHFRCR